MSGIFLILTVSGVSKTAHRICKASFLAPCGVMEPLKVAHLQLKMIPFSLVAFSVSFSWFTMVTARAITIFMLESH